MHYDCVEDQNCVEYDLQTSTPANYQHWSSDSENAGSPVLDRVLEDTADYFEDHHHHELQPLLSEDQVTGERHASIVGDYTASEEVKEGACTSRGTCPTQDQLGQKRTLDQSKSELWKWEMTAFELWSKKVMSQQHWKHALARRIIDDIIEDAVDFSDCRYRILGDGNEVRLNFDKQFVCNDTCIEFTLRGWFNDRPLLLDACTCCQLTTTRDVRALLMRIARKWGIKKLNFLTLHFTTKVNGNKFEVRGDLIQGLRQRGVLDFHFCAL